MGIKVIPKNSLGYAWYLTLNTNLPSLPQFTNLKNQSFEIHDH